MAEKSTRSILETIKNKMLKLDRKDEKSIAVSNQNEEFQYISFGAPVAAAKPVEEKVETTTVVKNSMPKFEDNLGLDIADKPAPVKQPEKNGGMKSFDDFNLDDLDLDNEEKTFAAPANPPANNSVAATLPKLEDHDPELEEDDAEDFEDDVEMEEEEQETDGVKPDLDWLGNPVQQGEGEQLDELNLDVDVKLDEKTESVNLDLEHLEEIKEDELDLEHLETETEEVVEEDDLDLENLEDDLDLEHLEVEEAQKEQPFVATQVNNSKEDDLESEEEYEEEEVEIAEEGEEDLEHEEELGHVEESSEDADFDLEEDLEQEEHLEEDHEEEFLEEVIKPQPQTNNVLPSISDVLDDDLNFDDLEHDDEDELLQEPQELPSFSGGAQITSQTTTQTMTKEELPAFSSAVEPVVEKHEIDLEFEKDIMGFKAGASETIVAAVPPIQNVNQMSNSSQMPMQNNVSMLSQQNSQVQVADSKPFESTVRQVSDSVKKLIDAKNVVSGISSFSQSPALAELALHLMEPKIEKWFNDNLPELVEKVVREEIKKMIPKE